MSQSFLKGSHNPITLTKYVGFFFCPLIFDVYINCDSFYLHVKIISLLHTLSPILESQSIFRNPVSIAIRPKHYFVGWINFYFRLLQVKKKIFRSAITPRKVGLCTEGKIFTRIPRPDPGAGNTSPLRLSRCNPKINWVFYNG
jgi:hypothetical protein